MVKWNHLNAKIIVDKRLPQNGLVGFVRHCPSHTNSVSKTSLINNARFPVAHSFPKMGFVSSNYSFRCRPKENHWADTARGFLSRDSRPERLLLGPQISASHQTPPSKFLQLKPTCSVRLTHDQPAPNLRSPNPVPLLLHIFHFPHR